MLHVEYLEAFKEAAKKIEDMYCLRGEMTEEQIAYMTPFVERAEIDIARITSLLISAARTIGVEEFGIDLKDNSQETRDAVFEVVQQTLKNINDYEWRV